jgi:hypothetical protein
VKDGSPDLVASTNRLADRTIMEFSPKTYQGTVVEPFLFTKGDPAGTYILEISINGKKHTIISYEAYVQGSL